MPDQIDPRPNMTPRSDGNPDNGAQRARTADDRVERDRASRALERDEVTCSWQDIKSRFVDDPAGAIAAAEDMLRRAVDEKVRALKAEITEVCAARDEDASSTEALRNRLIRYQVYCEKLAASGLH